MNKKMIAMVALTCVVTCITGCGSKKEDEVPDVTKQLEVIEEQADVWKVSEEKDVALWFRDINAENLLDSYKKFSGK